MACQSAPLRFTARLRVSFDIAAALHAPQTPSVDRPRLGAVRRPTVGACCEGSSSCPDQPVSAPPRRWTRRGSTLCGSIPTARPAPVRRAACSSSDSSPQPSSRARPARTGSSRERAPKRRRGRPPVSKRSTRPLRLHRLQGAQLGHAMQDTWAAVAGVHVQPTSVDTSQNARLQREADAAVAACISPVDS